MAGADRATGTPYQPPYQPPSTPAPRPAVPGPLARGLLFGAAAGVAFVVVAFLLVSAADWRTQHKLWRWIVLVAWMPVGAAAVGLYFTSRAKAWLVAAGMAGILVLTQIIALILGIYDQAGLTWSRLPFTAVSSTALAAIAVIVFLRRADGPPRVGSFLAIALAVSWMGHAVATVAHYSMIGLRDATQSSWFAVSIVFGEIDASWNTVAFALLAIYCLRVALPRSGAGTGGAATRGAAGVRSFLRLGATAAILYASLVGLAAAMLQSVLQNPTAKLPGGILIIIGLTGLVAIVLFPFGLVGLGQQVRSKSGLVAAIFLWSQAGLSLLGALPGAKVLGLLGALAGTGGLIATAVVLFQCRRLAGGRGLAIASGVMLLVSVALAALVVLILSDPPTDRAGISTVRHLVLVPIVAWLTTYMMLAAYFLLRAEQEPGERAVVGATA